MTNPHYNFLLHCELIFFLLLVNNIIIIDYNIIASTFVNTSKIAWQTFTTASKQLIKVAYLYIKALVVVHWEPFPSTL